MPARVDGTGGLCRSTHRGFLSGQGTDRGRGPGHLSDLQGAAGVSRLRQGRQRHDGILGRNVGARAPAPRSGGVAKSIPYAIPYPERPRTGHIRRHLCKRPGQTPSVVTVRSLTRSGADS